MKTPLVIVVTGPPGSGKTTLAREVSRGLGLPLFAKNFIKETLFDRLGVASFEVQLLGASQFLEAGQGVVLEGDFDHDAASRLVDMVRAATAQVVQIYCYADTAELMPATRAARFRATVTLATSTSSGWATLKRTCATAAGPRST